MLSRNYLFYAVVALATACDQAVLTGVVWMSLKLSGSTLPLGIVLCLSVAVPFVLDLASRGRAADIGATWLVALRIVAFLVAALFAWCGLATALSFFLLIALMVGTVDFLTASSLEIENTRRVVAGWLPADNAARYMQTAIQVGGFSGSLAGGGLLGLLSDSTFLLCVALSGAALSPALLLARMKRGVPVAAQGHEQRPTSQASPAPFQMPYAAMACLGLIALHIGAFNSMMPIVYQQVNHWSPTSYGIASGVAGLGAFLAALIPLSKHRLAMFATALIVVDALMVLAPQVLLSMVGAFLVGFITNHLRIVVRSQLMRAANNDAQAALIGSRSTFCAYSMQATAPLLLTFATTASIFGPASGPALMIGTGVVSATGLLGLAQLRRQAQSLPLARL
ncbi:hypothetical protein [Pseudomonas sp. MH9.3]|uniref:hypothetical protein n=1 Tax=Pseudomonas sp. MH9.3 TaxID=3048630 RepID=UPI002AC8B2CC|nr:hypothetical protein [Pseudomonas sp. MH9.3]MEB0107377.1 hypothetical protein [Pseudomonas sp. MH9.3]WPX81829.1 hypothetical protein RHM60_12210 [Pseudomonas sp. MH9.3]